MWKFGLQVENIICANLGLNPYHHSAWIVFQQNLENWAAVVQQGYGNTATIIMRHTQARRATAY
ncbi:hypothetical protein GCM10027594_11440 [Hymenobacter agri]